MKSIVLLPALLLALVPSSALAEQSFVLQNQTYSISTTIYVSSSGPETPPIHLTESYSFEQGRAKLSYYHFSPEEEKEAEREFIYDSKTRSGLFHEPGAQTCAQSSNLSELYDELFYGKQTLLEGLYRTIDQEMMDDSNMAHVIGPAKLMYYIVKKWDSFEENSATYFKMRNRHAVRFEYRMVRCNAQIVVYYDRIVLVSAHKTIHRLIPIQAIVYSTQQADYYITFDFHRLQVLFGQELVPRAFSAIDANMLAAGSGLSDEQANSQPVADLFSFPVGLDCSERISADNRVILFRDFQPRLIRLSTRIDAFEASSLKTSHFVAYDGVTLSLRLESSRGPNFNSPLSVWDLLLNRKYQMRRPGKRGPNGPNEGASCAITQVYPPSKSSSQFQFDLAKFLFGSHVFSFMGLARVGGVACRAFESNSRRLPEWYTKPTLVKNRAGAFEQLNAKQKVAGNYSTVVYIAIQDSNNSKPVDVVQMEVFDLVESRVWSSRKLLRAKFRQFAWDLSESPGGDKPSELFSVSKACSLNHPDQTSFQLNLLLEQDEEPKEGKNFKNFTWLESSAADRNKALQAAIKDSLGLQNTMIHDLRSVVLQPPAGASKLSILLDFRVAERPQVLNTLSLITDTITLKPMDGSTRHRKLEADSLGECLQLIEPAHKRTSYVYFYERGRKCFVDPELASGDEPRKSALFEFLDNNSGPTGAQLYKVDSELDAETNKPNSWLRDGMSQRMENRRMVLQNIKPEGQSPASIDRDSVTTVRIRRLKLTNNNYQNSAKKSLVGFKLPEQFADGSGLVVRRLEVGEDGEEPSFRRRLSSAMVSLQLCEAACLEQLDCRSYSYCNRPPGDCLISSLSLDFESIQSALSNATHKGKSVKIQLENSVSVELPRDRSCELHRKLHLPMFQQTYSYLASLARMQLMPVAEPEECARLCFAESLESIGELARLNERAARELPKLSDDLEKRKSLEAELKGGQWAAMSKFCSFFLYLEPGSLSEQQAGELLRELMLRKPETRHAPQAYCMLLDRNKAAPPETNQTQTFRASYYNFDYTSLYEKLHGLGIRESPKSVEVMEAYYKFTSATIDANTMSLVEPDEQDYRLVSDFLLAGGNFQLRSDAEPSYCANACFRQTSKLWPACQSFDTLRVGNSWDQESAVACHLNTRSLEQLKPDSNQSGLVQVWSRGNGGQMWHYELRFGPLRTNARTLYDLQLDQLESEHQESNALTFANTFRLLASSRLGAKSIMAIVTIGLASGLLLGVQLARRLLMLGGGAALPASALGRQPPGGDNSNKLQQQLAMALRGESSSPIKSAHERLEDSN